MKLSTSHGVLEGTPEEFAQFLRVQSTPTLHDLKIATPPAPIVKRSYKKKVAKKSSHPLAGRPKSLESIAKRLETMRLKREGIVKPAFAKKRGRPPKNAMLAVLEKIKENRVPKKEPEARQRIKVDWPKGLDSVADILAMESPLSAAGLSTRVRVSNQSHLTERMLADHRFVRVPESRQFRIATEAEQLAFKRSGPKPKVWQNAKENPEQRSRLDQDNAAVKKWHEEVDKQRQNPCKDCDGEGSHKNGMYCESCAGSGVSSE